MVGRPLPPPCIHADGHPVAGVHSEIGRLGGYDLTIATTVGEMALDVQTTVLGHPATTTHVSWIARARGLALSGAEKLPPGGLRDSTAIARRLLEHYAHVQAAIEELAGVEVSIDIDDHALVSAVTSAWTS